MLLAAGGMVWLTLLGLHSTYPAHVLPPLLVIGAGIGLAMPAAISQASRHADGARRIPAALRWAG
jgi:hypothetical protein